ncbi:hypothetical protein WMY93_008108 [Mugilogobius chulae]|uniref:SUN domain-containing protein n=1 Tax=Mugilogobius chulae TaxID=88201 RepID=A0AAW0PP04_9GOBI
MSRRSERLIAQGYYDEEVGGQIVHGLTSKGIQKQTSQTQWGDIGYYTARSVIRGKSFPLIPGHCWPMEGSTGQVFIQLAQKIHISHVTLAHITKELSPIGQIYTAPRKFSTYGLREIGGDEYKLGTYEYSDTGDSFQTFQIQDHADEMFKFVRLEIESNYGSNYTCLYNFRVHGRIAGETRG